MNTDNTTISGETIDYGPCAFMDTFDPAAVFSSIDDHGRYARRGPHLVSSLLPGGTECPNRGSSLDWPL
jgi:serine/tyrosine/threonine adenylyltransferase